MKGTTLLAAARKSVVIGKEGMRPSGLEGLVLDMACRGFGGVVSTKPDSGLSLSLTVRYTRLALSEGRRVSRLVFVECRSSDGYGYVELHCWPYNYKP